MTAFLCYAYGHNTPFTNRWFVQVINILQERLAEKQKKNEWNEILIIQPATGRILSPRDIKKNQIPFILSATQFKPSYLSTTGQK